MMTNQNAVDFAIQFKATRKKTAESVLDLASVSYAAKERLTDTKDYEIFLHEIGEKANSSYLKKLNCIAKKESRFRANLDLLPPSSASIYQLSQFEDQLFDQFVAEKKIFPSMTLKDIANLVPKATSSSPPVSQSVTVAIELTNLNVIHQFYRDLKDLQQKYNLVVHDEALKKVLDKEQESANDESYELADATNSLAA